MNDFIITKDQIDKMFLHYLKLRLQIRNANCGSYNEAWYCGQAQECEKWLNMLGIDTSYDVVEPLLDEKKVG